MIDQSYPDLFGHKIIKVSNTRLSPLRYPGGKTWAVPSMMQWCENHPCTEFIEPFAGGASISLNMVIHGYVPKAIFGDIDDDLATLWKVILSNRSSELCDLIKSFSMDYNNVLSLIDVYHDDIVLQAFQTLLKNRTSYGGIIHKGGFLKKGDGKGIASRWNPNALCKRIETINKYAKQFSFKKDDAFSMIDRYKNRTDVLFFIDPPYTAGGKNVGKSLYRHHFLDHDKLFHTMKSVKSPFMMTYDDIEEVRNLIQKYGFSMHIHAMNGNKNVEKKELFIFNRW